MEINTEHWWNCNGRRNEILGEKPVHHESYIDWPQDIAVYLLTFYTPM
jgi:myo-inositol catabolism protein IolC